MSEAFVYLWYDAPNKKYYLGKHKGSPDDTYTHSSTIWEHFTKDNIPEGVTRRILAYGTDEEMCVLEHELLVNRKKRCWNRYYNNSLGDPRYVDTSGENNPNYKHGKYVGGEENKKIRLAYKNEQHKTPEYKEYLKKYRQTPQQKTYRKAWEQTPKRKAYKKKRRQTPEYRENHRLWKQAWRARKKAERQGVGTLEPYL